MSKFVTLHGFSTGPTNITGLNFEIVGGPNKPENPTENTIWVTTNYDISGWEISANSDVTGVVRDDGFVYISFTSSTSNDTSGFNSLVLNGMYIKPLAAYQYINGEWQVKTLQIYKNNEWFINVFNPPEFTYTGDYESSVEGDDWVIKFLSSGDLVFTNINAAVYGLDVFLVGGGGNGGISNPNAGIGGGGGGGGGYTVTEQFFPDQGEVYTITVGGSAGSTQAFGFTANPGGNGGTGQYTEVTGGGAGGAGTGRGGNGGAWSAPGWSGPGGAGADGIYAFDYTSGIQYGAGGGGGGANLNNGTAGGAGGKTGGGRGATSSGNGGAGTANTGGGGGGATGSGYTGGRGGSGIVIIRNVRGNHNG